jgi:uncharacterized protein YbcI
MSGEKLVHSTEVDLNGDQYEIQVFRRDDGRFFARTSFGENDIIIHDGTSLEEVLSKHEQVLSLAVTSRSILQMVKSDLVKQGPETA